jgi:hypothetical protein
MTDRGRRFEGTPDEFELAALALREKLERDRATGGAEPLEGLARRFELAAADARTPTAEVAKPGGRAVSFAGRHLARWVLQLTIVALVVSALIAIVGVLTGDFGEIEGRVLLGVAAIWLCGLAFLAGVRGAASRSLVGRGVGYAAQLLALCTLVFALVLIGWWHEVHDAVIRGFWFIALLAGASAHASYLLGRRTPRDRVDTVIVGGTLAALSVVAAMLGLFLIDVFGSPSTGFWRVFAVFAVLLTLGNLLLPVLARLRRSGG